MDKGDFAQWMQREHERVDELVQIVREKLIIPPAGQRGAWLVELQDRFDHLRAHMIKHMSMEEEGGYLAPILERRPTLSGQVETLRNEHREFIQILGYIHRELHEAAPEDGLLIRDACERIHNCLSYLESHEQKETLLVFSVFTLDMGDRD